VAPSAIAGLKTPHRRGSAADRSAKIAREIPQKVHPAILNAAKNNNLSCVELP
jgi:hypothetical protein